MAISLTHAFVSGIADDPDNTLVQPSDWNAEHALTQATNTILGRVTGGTGSTEELTPAQVRSLLSLVSIATSGSAADLTTGILPAARFNDTAHGNRGGGSLHAAATTSVAGFMSSSDKTKLDGLSPVDVDRIASAWVNFDGDGTVSIRDSYNVSSITDNGAGDYTVNFTSSLANTNYSFFVTSAVAPSAGNQVVAGYRTTGAFNDVPSDKSTGSLRVLCRSTDGTNRDVDQVNVVIFGGN